MSLVLAGYPACRDEASVQTAAKLGALRDGITTFVQSQQRLPQDLEEVCTTNQSWCAHQTAEQWTRDAWGAPIDYRGTTGGYVLASSRRDHRSGTRDDLVIEVDVERVRVDAVVGCYLLSAAIPRLASDTLEFTSRVTGGGYAIQRARLIDGLDVFIAEWRLTERDGFVADWVRIDHGVRMAGRIANGRLEARVDGQRISGTEIKCSSSRTTGWS